MLRVRAAAAPRRDLGVRRARELGDRELAPDGTGTELELVHDAPSAPEHWDRSAPARSASAGSWRLIGLAQHLAAGAAVDPASVAAWMASDDGVGFMRRVQRRAGSRPGSRPATTRGSPGPRPHAARAAYTGQE